MDNRMCKSIVRYLHQRFASPLSDHLNSVDTLAIFQYTFVGKNRSTVNSAVMNSHRKSNRRSQENLQPFEINVFCLLVHGSAHPG